MGEEIKFRRETIFKVLGWGAAIYFILIGYALNQHGMFELITPEELDRLHQAQVLHAEALDRKSDGLKEKDPVEAARLSVDAARIRMEVGEAKKEQSDSWYRAIGLVLVVLVYSVVYPLAIWLVYKRTDSGGALAERDPFPLKAALIYGIMMSVITSVSAMMTAYQ